jgi:hypothetical protein
MKRQGLSASVSASNKMKRPWQESVTAVTMTAQAAKKNKFAKSEKSVTKSGKKTNTESGPMYCTHCKTDMHNTERCWKLKKIAREKELSEKSTIFQTDFP